jgi:hypothetical protein
VSGTQLQAGATWVNMLRRTIAILDKVHALSSSFGALHIKLLKLIKTSINQAIALCWREK